MSYVCPICNGLDSAPLLLCPNCHQETVDCGLQEDYAGPYSPYVASSHDQTIPAAANHCLHLMHCPHCLTEFSYAVDTWYVPDRI